MFVEGVWLEGSVVKCGCNVQLLRVAGLAWLVGVCVCFFGCSGWCGCSMSV